MTNLQALEIQREKNRQLDLLLRLIKAHPKSTGICAPSEIEPRFEYFLLAELSPDIAERLRNEIIGFLQQELHRGTAREFDIWQIIKDKSLPPKHFEREIIVPIYHINRNFGTSNV